MFGKSEEQKEEERIKKEKQDDLQQRVAQYKPLLDRKGVIVYKDEYCVILQKMKSKQVEFIIAFSDLTKEGYQLMARDVSEVIHNISSRDDTSLYYYFQKIDFVK